jgi:hypothetical protein
VKPEISAKATHAGKVSISGNSIPVSLLYNLLITIQIKTTKTRKVIKNMNCNKNRKSNKK